MSEWTLLVVAVAVLLTSFLSGIFGMLGGAILIGVLLAFLPVPLAMTLHAIAQMTANGQRAALWRLHILWPALFGYLVGAALVFTLLSLVRFSPPKAWVYLLLGLLPFVTYLIPRNSVPDIQQRGTPITVGMLVMTMMVLAGVPGAVLDMFFQNRKLDRRAVIATKAAMQTAGNIAKSAYFTLIVAVPGQSVSHIELSPWLVAMIAGLAICGTLLAKPVLHRFSDETFHWWTQRLMLVVSAVYLVKGATELLG